LGILLQLAMLYWEGLLQFDNTILVSLITIGNIILGNFIIILRYNIEKFYYNFAI